MTLPQPDLASFLARLTPAAREEVVWGGATRLYAACYIGGDIPPLDWVTSVRSVILRDDEVLVLSNENETHIMPGGRREEGETLDETLRREVAEETGWEIEPLAVLGFIHFRHLTPKPPGYRYPYPDFIHLLYVSLPTRELPGARLEDDYERECAFRPVAEMLGPAAAEIGPNQVLYLQAALDVAGQRGRA